MKHKLQLFYKKHNPLLICPAIFLSCFTLSFITSSLIITPQPIKAVDDLDLISPPSISLSSSTNTLNMTITPTPTGTLASTSHDLITNTNVHTGFILSIAAPNPPTLPHTTGTIDRPIALTNNTWGYAIPGISGFDPSYTTPTPAATSKWANPSTAATIKITNAAATNDTTTIYYGAKVDLNQASGTYPNTVQYTATAQLGDITTPSISSITPNSGTTAGGTSIAIVGGGFTQENQSVTTAVTIDGVACENVSISSNTPTTGRDTIYCDVPAHPTAGSVDVAVTTWHSTVTTTNGYTYAAPTPTITAPTASQIFNAGTTSTNLDVTTNYPAICYYGTTASPTTQMTTTGSTTHSVNLTGLTNASTNTRYVRCQAATGHSFSTNIRVTFYVRAATPAIPTLNPANGTTVDNGTTTITVTSPGATCKWGTSNGSYPNASDTTRTTTTGINTLYYSCTAGSGNTQSEARTGSWIYTGRIPPGSTGSAMQTVNTSNCPTTRTRVIDARDNATYWIQKLADGKCWMLTNLAYAGGGTDVYGDVKDISNGEAYNYSYTDPYYYVPPGSNRTNSTTDPSTSTDGTGQYGYLYNWCAAMGIQTGTLACASVNATVPPPDASISICPSGWRLPTGENGELLQLNNSINNGSTSSDAGLRSTWLAMYSGHWYNSFRDQGNNGRYWSSTPYPSSPSNAYGLGFSSSYVDPSGNGASRLSGLAIRCLAAS